MGFNTFDSSGKQQLVNSIANMPFGSIIDWPTDTAPAGWLKCDGSAVSRTSYQDLFLAIGTNYGVGNGSTTFNLPDITGSIIYASAVAKAGSNLLPAVSDGAVTTAKLADSAVTAAKIASSTIARSVGASVSTAVSSTSTSFVDITGLSVTIAPSSTSKKILIVANLIIGSSAFAVSRFRLMRDTTAININSDGNSVFFIHDSADRTYQVPLTFLDTPSTTSSITYKIQWLIDGNTIYLNRRNTEVTPRGTSNIQAIEVDAA